MRARTWVGVVAAVAASIIGAAMAGGEAPPAAAPAPVSLKDAPVNTWVKVLQTPTGWRESPVFVYVPSLKRFVMASGMQSYGGMVPRHYDTEELDLAALKWVNAYPPAVAAGRPESGPVGDDYSKARIDQGSSGRTLFYKDGESLRPGAGGQWTPTRTNYEWTLAPQAGKIYAYLFDHTISYDVAARTWEDLGAKPRTSCRIWGSMGYDPVNKEILHSGGDGGSAEVGTWVYGIEKNEWRRPDFGSEKMKALSAKAKALVWQAKALLGACCNRFAISETPEEAKADLVAKAAETAAAAERLAADVKAAGLATPEQAAGEVAARRLEAAAAALKAAGPTLSGTTTAPRIAAVRAARVICEQVVDALASEPPGRARSQTAYDYDPTAGLMFYFDRAYNPAVREWEPAPWPGLEHKGPMHSFLAPTPKGMVTYSEKGLFRFEAKGGRWQKLPWNGPAFGPIWCDGHALRYDSKRDCLWMANDKAIFRYDLATGKAEKLDVKKPKALGQFIFWSEEVYLPDADLILLMKLFKTPDGKFTNVAWDPADGKFYWVDLAFIENAKPVQFKDSPFSWSDALRHDPGLKLTLLNNSSARKVWVLKFDRKTARMEEMKEE